MAEILELTDEAFEEEVLNSELPALVDFWAPWCGPCKAIAPIVKELAEEYDGRLKVAKVNVDDNQGAAMRYQVRGIPTLLIFKGGEVKQQVVGAVPKEVLTEKIDAALED
ncbi:MAG: thioredoxin [Candidatus Poribacteria bacterium]|nr:thioredoxin [Candidatus Poribacteria bacterium]